jgi:hypothetical protein
MSRKAREEALCGLRAWDGLSVVVPAPIPLFCAPRPALYDPRPSSSSLVGRNRRREPKSAILFITSAPAAF